MTAQSRVAAVALAVALLGLASAQLPRLSIDPSGISISGLSSGADFTVQFQTAYSSILRGSAVFAGQPYHCAVTRFPRDELQPHPNPSVPICDGCPPGTTLLYDHCKTHPDWVVPELLASYAHNASAAGQIDDVQHLAKSRIFVYRGTKDPVYHNGSLQHVVDFFAHFTAKEQIFFEKTIPSAHSWPTDDYGPPCGSGVIENCGYDGPGAALQWIYGHTLKPKSAYTNSSMRAYTQAHYNRTGAGLADQGLLYVPAACAAPGAACQLHLCLHGCGEEGYYEPMAHQLFNGWAEANKMVILYPRIQPHGSTGQTRSGCWDGYAQSGAGYALRTGPQMAALREMIADLAGV